MNKRNLVITSVIVGATMSALIITRLFGLWPDWMIYLELIIKAGL